MAAPITLQLKSRSKKGTFKKQPASIEIPGDATVEDTKKVIARAARVGDYNRVGLFDSTTNRTLKDKKALIRDIKSIMASGELLVKDLGLQMPWKLVFVIEYIGPILIHILFVLFRPYIYTWPVTVLWPWPYKNEAETPMTLVQWISFGLFVGHFGKRELETIFLHKFSANTMPAWNIFRNSFYYWAAGGLLTSFFLYSPDSVSARDSIDVVDIVGLVIIAVGEWLNFVVHVHLASLRKPGGTERAIPNCIGSSLVTSPNYMFECLAWLGFIIFTRNWSVAGYIVWGILYMRPWSIAKEKALRAEFGDKYKKKRYTMLPGLI